jgi:hypothetical protein
MARKKSLRRRPSTPDFQFQDGKLSLDFPPGVDGGPHHHQLPHTAATDPASPPETPTASPPLSRKISLKPRHQPPFDFGQALARDPAIRPFGNGHQFSYRPGVGLDQMSPRSSPASSTSSDSVGPVLGDSAVIDESDHESVASLVPSFDTESSDEDEDDAEDEDADADMSADESSRHDGPDSELDADEELDARPPRLRKSRVRIVQKTYSLVIEEVDPMDSDIDGLDILFPTEVESIRSQSRSRQNDAKDFDKSIEDDFERLNCNNDILENELNNELDSEIIAFLQNRLEIKRRRRRFSSSSCGKRTHSEMSCESDGEDGSMDVNDVGSSAWRMRKKLHRSSLLFHDPPIDELEEPDSSEDDFAPEQSLAMELPYYTLDVMEVESSSDASP